MIGQNLCTAFVNTLYAAFGQFVRACCGGSGFLPFFRFLCLGFYLLAKAG
jgi:hypothetical protein